MILAPWQHIVADTYGDGDYAEIESVDEARHVGDTLFLFLMIELDPKEDCDSQAEACRRVETAINQLRRVQYALLTKEPA